MASEDSSSTNALKFAKLTGSNYRTWSFNIRLYLESLDLFEHVEGTAEVPDGDPTSKAVKTFHQRAKKAWTYICLAVEPDQQIHVRDTKTAEEAWNALKTQFSRSSILQKVRLRQQYYSCKFVSGGNMLQHINHLKSLHEQLKEIGANIDDQELAMTLLSSLPEEFKPLSTALDAVGEENVNFEKVKGMLLNDIDRSSDIGQARKSENALYMNRSTGFKKGWGRHNRAGIKGESFRGNCHFCKEQGHFARDCPKKHGNSDDSNKRNNRFSANYVAIHQRSDDMPPEEALITSQFGANECNITRNGKLLAIGKLVGKLYFLKLASSDHVNLAKSSTPDTQLWHYRLGHLSIESVKKLSRESMAHGIKLNHDDGCKSDDGDLIYPDGWQPESAEEENQPQPEPPINQPVGERLKIVLCMTCSNLDHREIAELPEDLLKSATLLV
eukprot:gene1502-1660_t